MENTRRKENLLILGVIMAACCIRPPISGVGPLVSQIGEALSLSASTAGMLTTIPLLLYSMISPAVSHLALVIPSRIQIAVCVAMIAIGTLIRSYVGVFGLFFGTILIGIGVGVLNVVIPLFVKSNFAGRIGDVMALYTATMTALSAIASGSISFLSDSLGGWDHALAIFALIPILAFPIWMMVTRGFEEPVIVQSEDEPVAPLWSCGNWYTAIFFGLQSFLYFGIIAWLPSILTVSVGSASQVAMMMFVMQLASLISNFAMPPAIQRTNTRQRKWLGLACATVYLTGFVVILLALERPSLAWTGIILLGLAGGMSISYILTFISIKAGTRRDTARLSAFAQCGGYLIAAPGPFLIGALTDYTGAFVFPVYILIAVCVLFLYFGYSLAGAGEKR